MTNQRAPTRMMFLPLWTGEEGGRERGMDGRREGGREGRMNRAREGERGGWTEGGRGWCLNEATGVVLYHLSLFVFPCNGYS